jgi:hypothetical protein
MQIIDLVVEIDSQVLAGIVEFRLTRCKYSRRGEQEGPDYKGKAFPKVVHTSMPPWRFLFGSGEGIFAGFDL